jgi:hypothetical protein
MAYLTEILREVEEKIERQVVAAGSLKELGDLRTDPKSQYSVVGFFSGSRLNGGIYIFDGSLPANAHDVDNNVFHPEALKLWDGTASGIATLRGWVPNEVDDSKPISPPGCFVLFLSAAQEGTGGSDINVEDHLNMKGNPIIELPEPESDDAPVTRGYLRKVVNSLQRLVAFKPDLEVNETSIAAQHKSFTVNNIGVSQIWLDITFTSNVSLPNTFRVYGAYNGLTVKSESMPLGVVSINGLLFMAWYQGKQALVNSYIYFLALGETDPNVNWVPVNGVTYKINGFISVGANNEW